MNYCFSIYYEMCNTKLCSTTEQVTTNVLPYNRNHDTHDMKVCKSLHMLVMILGFHHSATEILALLKCCKVPAGSLYVGGFTL